MILIFRGISFIKRVCTLLILQYRVLCFQIIQFAQQIQSKNVFTFFHILFLIICLKISKFTNIFTIYCLIIFLNKDFFIMSQFHPISYLYNKTLTLEKQLFMDYQDLTQLQDQIQPEGSHLQFDEQSHVKDYSSVERLVYLPRERKILPNQNIFPPVENELIKSEQVSQGLKNTLVDLRDKLRTEFYTYNDAKNFKFIFPESKFPPVQPGTRNLITYEQKNIVEEQDTFRDKLSPQQIEQISQNGEFNVRSNHEYITLPYVWKINDSLFQGRQNIQLTWFKIIAKAHTIIYQSFETFKTEIPQEFKKIKTLPSRLFSLLAGKRSMQATYSIDYDTEIAKDFWDEVMSKYYVKSKQWGSDLWQYFDAGYKAQDFMTIRKIDEEQNNIESDKQFQKKIDAQNKSQQKYNKKVNENAVKKQKIYAISDQFQRNWTKNKKKIFAQVTNQMSKNSQQNGQDANESEELIKKRQKQNEEQILQKFNDKKFQCYTIFLQKKLQKIDVPNNVVEAIITILTLLQISSKKQRKFNAKKSQQRSKVQKKIRQQHKIKQYNIYWYAKQVQKIYQPIEKRLQDQYLNKFIDIELIKKLNMKQKQVYNLWLQYRVTFKARVQAKKRQISPLQQATRTFHSTYLLLPPYKVIKHQNTGYTWYEMIKQQKMQVTTDKPFWKLKLYLMRVKSWTINCIVFLIYFCWRGVFGLRCLYGMAEFRHSQNIDYNTGEIINLYRKPVLGVFQNVLKGIKNSRQAFEALPDRGLFGKNFSRFFNYIECYIFRFLFVGILITLILYPIAIVLSSVLTAILILTVWLWMPVVLLITYFFNILIYQFESGHVPYGFLVRFVPLLSLVINLVWYILTMLFLCMVAFVFAPIGSFFVSFYAIIARGFRTVTDAVMLFLIKKLGRTPSRNTAIAKKISGPGMSKEYYMSINQQDVYILIQSQLQQILMIQYNRIFLQKVNKPLNRFNNVLGLIFKPLNQNFYYTPQNQNILFQTITELTKRYYTEYSNYINRFPIRPQNTRFTQDQIDAYFDNTVSIVRSFVEKKEIKSWIFEDYHILEDYEELTRKIWMAVFNCGEEIFEPLQKIDQRFKLEDMYKNQNMQDQDSSTSFGNAKMKRNVHKVMEALQGEIQLKPRKANITPFKHGLMNKEIYGNNVRQLLSLMDQNSQGRTYFSLQVPRFVFFVNLPIKEIIKKDAYEYQWRKQENQKKRQLN